MDLLNAYLGIFEKGGTASFKKKKGGILDIFATPLYTAMSSARGVTFIFTFHFHSVSCTFWRAPADLLVLIPKDLGCSTEEHIKDSNWDF